VLAFFQQEIAVRRPDISLADKRSAEVDADERFFYQVDQFGLIVFRIDFPQRPLRRSEELKLHKRAGASGQI
jgi:hypothetical protein